VDGIDSRSCPVVGVGIIDVHPSNSATGVVYLLYKHLRKTVQTTHQANTDKLYPFLYHLFHSVKNTCELHRAVGNASEKLFFKDATTDSFGILTYSHIINDHLPISFDGI
jgi:hypothetical protein